MSRIKVKRPTTDAYEPRAEMHHIIDSKSKRDLLQRCLPTCAFSTHFFEIGLFSCFTQIEASVTHF